MCYANQLPPLNPITNFDASPASKLVIKLMLGSYPVRFALFNF